MKKSVKRRWLLLLLPAVLVLLLMIIDALRLDPAVRIYTEETPKVSTPVRLAVVADLHSAWYGEGQAELLELIEDQRPDLLLLAGDIVDDKLPPEGAETLLQRLGTLYPCYYVTGNHEHWSGEAAAIKEQIRSYGIQIMEGDTVVADCGGQKLCLSGVDDPSAASDDSLWKGQLESCMEARDEALYSILLSHRPERTDEYAASGFDLVLCGHAHGGQVRIPGLINGVYAPDQGFFPAYAGGRYSLGDTVMIVSRGLSKKILPRIYNRPELVIVDIVPAAS